MLCTFATSSDTDFPNQKKKKNANNTAYCNNAISQSPNDKRICYKLCCTS